MSLLALYASPFQFNEQTSKSSINTCYLLFEFANYD